jgi:hypothetical protein
MMSQYAVRGGNSHRRHHHYPRPINIKPVSTTVVLYDGAEGKSFIPTVPLDVISCCRTDGNAFSDSGPFPVYFGPAVNGAYGRIVTYRDICDNQGSIVKCRFGLNCNRVHANMGVVMTGMKGTKPQVIGPLRADLKKKHMELFTMNAEQLARRQAINNKALASQREQLQRLEDEENALDGDKDEQAELAERILRAEAKKALREAETSSRGIKELVARGTKPAKKRRRLEAPGTNIEPTVQLIDEADPILAAAVPSSSIKVEEVEPTMQVIDEADPDLAAAVPISIIKAEEADAADTGLGDNIDIVDPSDTAASNEPAADGESDTTTTGEPNAPPGENDEVVRADDDGI